MLQRADIPAPSTKNSAGTVSRQEEQSEMEVPRAPK